MIVGVRLTESQRQALEWIASAELAGEWPSQRELGEAMGWRSSATSWEMVRRLERAGLVDRLYRPGSRLARAVRLTTLGWEALRRDGWQPAPEAVIALLRSLEERAIDESERAALRTVTQLAMRQRFGTGATSVDNSSGGGWS